MIANQITTSSGRLRAVCEYCGRKTKPVLTQRDRLSILDVAVGWSVAPYPADFVHADSSCGSLWTCPRCNKRIQQGMPVSPTLERAVRRQFAARLRELRAS